MQPSAPTRDDAGGNAFENRLGEAAAQVEFAAVGLELLRHFVESAHQGGQFVDGADFDAVVQVARCALHWRRRSSAEMGTLICLARNSAIQVATNRVKSVISAMNMR